MKIIQKGKYRHYKGNVYKIIAMGRDSETLDEVVVYQGLYDSKEFGNRPVWVRPAKMFFEKVNIKGKTIPRFEYVGK